MIDIFLQTAFALLCLNNTVKLLPLLHTAYASRF